MILHIEEKKIRSRVIRAYIREASIPGVVCFSCGNASKYLIQAGVPTLDISPKGGLLANKWWTPEEIHVAWPHLFDATSGHLPLFLMIKIAKELRAKYVHLVPSHGALGIYEILTGSGETITCMRMAFPNATFIPVTDGTSSTQRNPQSALEFLLD